MDQKTTLHATAFLLTVVSIFHFIRAMAGWQIDINGWNTPLWLSVITFIITGVLAFKMWKIAK
jgi:hypothetical protein